MGTTAVRPRPLTARSSPPLARGRRPVVPPGLAG
jgi:hypothetical protein